MLPEDDAAVLASKGIKYQVSKDSGAINLVISNFPLPQPYIQREVELLIRLPISYPNARPDMFWTRPDVKLPSGAWPLNADVKENYVGLPWQRWSRHWTGRWRPGVDGLKTFLAAIVRELERGR